MPLAVNPNVVIRQIPGQSVDGESGSSYILYDDVVNYPGRTLTASSTNGSRSVSLLADYLGYDYWQAAIGTQAIVSLTLPVLRPVSYFGVAHHDLGTRAALIDFQYSLDDVAWTSCLAAPVLLASDAPAAFIFTEVTARYFRLVLNYASSAPRIGVLMCGKALRLQRGVYVGHRPAPYQRNVRFASNETDVGQFVGRSRVRVGNDTELSLARLSPSWVRQYWQPFALHAETLPFFFVWNKIKYEREVIFGWADDMPKPNNQHQSFMAVSLSIRGNA